MAFVKLLVFALAVCVAAEAAIAPGAFRGLVQAGVKGEQNCQCMNWRNCDGEINSDVQCTPSFVMVCCIRPKPEPIPEYVPEVVRV